MKSIFRPSLVALGIIGLSSLTACNDFLTVEPTATDTPETVFSTVTGAYNSVIGAYAPLAGDASYGNRISGYFPYDSEDFLNSPTGDDAGEGRRGIARYNSAVTNADVRNAWNALYRGIGRANVCIKYIPEMELYNTPGAAGYEEVRRLHGEALTLRAQYFFELVRNWGDVPAPFEATETGQDFNIPRVDRNIIFDRLLADLDLAAKLVPWRSTAGAANERITKGAVKALRARVALYRAGFYFDPKTSRVERAADYRKFYDTVRVECRELMAMRGEHTLNTSFEEPFRSIAEYRRDAANEIVFQVAMGGTVNAGSTDSKLGYFNGPRTAISGGTQTQGAIVVQPTYFYAFDPTDTRRDVTIAPYTVDASSRRVPANLITAYDGKFRREWSSNAAVRNSAAQSMGYNWPLIRFSDVLLMFAEAENEALNGPSTDAQAALREVRARAYGSATLPAMPGSYTDFRDAIIRERNLEFGGEGIRKYDLMRWNLLGAKFQEIKNTLRAWTNATTPNLNIPTYMYYITQTVPGPLVAVNSYYGPSPTSNPPSGQTRVNWRNSITEARIADIAASYVDARQLLPIPAESRNTNPLLTQNPSYAQ
ncbi:RagB/SusD family nutrient uptake outer membrane protein [Hymenobacter edaphi]|uniref:RagB/SusD family nutrient uptake outer membrane protein n=1 Tax=Hymenobacter edaphi TaxID=2211146 RepID=A0A328B9Q8_9BACT|nr:RagB/SusD family nutrient uptake outer membrane protein [Hymenobacter edaphi]RAK63873.1 RagB/SusD family nutrient uptake outer membrane protein [Hymenobacter edaphi]